MKVVGLDLSLTSTGVAVVYTAAGKKELHRLRTKPAPGISVHDRMFKIYCNIRVWCRDADLVVVESPAYMAGGNMSSSLTGLWWVVNHVLYRDGLTIVVVPPPALKKYATGKGNASKDEVLAAIIRRYPDADVQGNDQADALALAAMGADQTGNPLAPVPAVNRDALKKWPYDGDKKSGPASGDNRERARVRR